MSKHFITWIVAGGLVIVAASNIASAQGMQWTAGFGSVGVDKPVHAMVVHDDGSGPALFAAGEFETAGGIVAHHVAKWDGIRCDPLDGGLVGTLAEVNALVSFDDGAGGGPKLYAGGLFTGAGGVSVSNVARWDNDHWSPVGSQLSGAVRALCVYDDGTGAALFAAGDFAQIGTELVRFIAKWTGSTWIRLGRGLSDPAYALAVFDDGNGPALYVGGSFHTAGSGLASCIARWDGSSWSALASGTNFSVHSLKVFDDGSGSSLYVGGNFTIAGGASANRAARWDGSTWSALGDGFSDIVLAFDSYDDGQGPALYATGGFDYSRFTQLNGIARWSGTNWLPLASGLEAESTGRTLAVFNDGSGGGPALYVGGRFSLVDGKVAARVAKWDGVGWSALSRGQGMDASVSAFTTGDIGNGPEFFAGGGFVTAGGQIVNGVGRWDGVKWHALGSGLGNNFVPASVTALCIHDDGSGPSLYAAGSFQTAGGVSANGIARWDGSTWSALGSGISGSVRAMTTFDDGSGPALYVGGSFFTAGAAFVGSIAKWDGATWSALGAVPSPFPGVHGSVYSLAAFDDGSGPALYVGGGFVSAGLLPASNIARWDGVGWSTVGGGVRAGTAASEALAMIVFDDGSGPALFVGGTFSTAGSISAPRIAKWDGQTWSALSTGIAGYPTDVSVLAVFDDGNGLGPALYAAGYFDVAGQVPASNIARWNGSTWSALGRGIGDNLERYLAGSVRSLIGVGPTFPGGPALYAGGAFTTAGNRASCFVARWANP